MKMMRHADIDAAQKNLRAGEWITQPGLTDVWHWPVYANRHTPIPVFDSEGVPIRVNFPRVWFWRAACGLEFDKHRVFTIAQPSPRYMCELCRREFSRTSEVAS